MTINSSTQSFTSLNKENFINKNVDEGISDNSNLNIFEKLIDKSKVSE